MDSYANLHRTTPKNLIILLSCFLINLFTLVIFADETGAGEILRPTSFQDIAGKTSGPSFAIDGNIGTAAVITTNKDALPSIIYHSWPPTTRYSSLTLYVERSATEHVDDKWGIEYSTNGGVTWKNLDAMSSSNIYPSEPVTMVLDPVQEVTSLQVRIISDRKKGPDNGQVDIFDIWTDGEIYTPPVLEQSAYRFFNNIDSVDLSAIVSNVGGADEATAIAIDDGYIYVAGFEPGNWRLEKRDIIDGYLNMSVTNDSQGEPTGIAIDDGYLYIVGNDYSEENFKWRIEKRFLSDLSLVQSFGINGVIFSDPSSENDSATAIAIGSGYMYIVGSDRTEGALDAQWRIEKRSLGNGELVSSMVNNPSSDNDIPYAIAIDSEFIYVVGYDRFPGSTNAQWRIEKRSLDTFALMAEASSNPRENSDICTGVAVDSEFMYVIGSEEYGFADTAWRIEKRSLDDLIEFTEHPDSQFPLMLDFGYDDRPQAIAIDSDFMYVAGFIAEIGGAGETAWHIEKRTLDSGELEYAITNDIYSDNNDRARAIAIDSTYMYVAGYDNPGLAEWRIEKRTLDDGTSALLEPLAAQNMWATFSDNQAFRLRMLLHVESGTLLVNEQEFKLQYEICGSDTWFDVNDTSPIVFNTNPTPFHGDGLLGTPDDPTHNGHITHNQIYVDTNSFTNSISTIESGDDGMWDFSLLVNPGYSGDYCLQIVKDNGESIGDYIFTPILHLN